MQVVEPIRDKRMVVSIGDFLKKWNKRYFLLYEVGIYTGLRISDILRLTYGDFIEEFGSGRRRWREHLHVREVKTGRMRSIPIRGTSLGNVLTGELKPITQWQLTEPLFLSQRKAPDGTRRAIARWQAYYVLRLAAYECGMSGRVGTHTLRKTFGYHIYQRTKNVAQLQVLFGHSNQSITLRYIGVSQDDHDAAYRILSFDGRGVYQKDDPNNQSKNEKQLFFPQDLY